MNSIAIRRVARCAPALAALMMVGCAAQPKTLYHWGDYQGEVYEYFKGTGDTPQAQLGKLEATQQQAQARSEALPPGFNAHLGLLYLQNGQADKAQIAFRTEETQFPESKPYIDFLMRNKAALPPKPAPLPVAPAAAPKPAATAPSSTPKPTPAAKVSQAQ